MKRLLLLCSIISMFHVYSNFRAGTDSAGEPLQFQSPFFRIELAPDQPAVVALSVDSLGKGKLANNPLKPPPRSSSAFQVRRDGQRIEYRPVAAPSSAPA